MAHKEYYWPAYADLMTLLMMIFLFISVSFLNKVKEQDELKNKIIEEYKSFKRNIYRRLVNEFEKDAERWGGLEIGKDLSIRFTNPQVLFATGKADLTPMFTQILDDFTPRYFAILLEDSVYSKLTDIRIEGHTDTTSFAGVKDSYMENMKLSQERAREVLNYMRNCPCFNLKLQPLLTANGYSFGRPLDDQKKFVHESGNPINNNHSRRVEFRLITKSEAVIELLQRKDFGFVQQ
jgi:outer membrane protein OmpA-like peptidoglycan-associated protein